MLLNMKFSYYSEFFSILFHIVHSAQLIQSWIDNPLNKFQNTNLLNMKITCISRKAYINCVINFGVAYF
jgi:hypothetical protein